MQNLHLPSGPLKLACLAAHPDDIEIAAGATLLALAERGSVEGYWLTLTGSLGGKPRLKQRRRHFCRRQINVPHIPRRAAPGALERRQGYSARLRG